MNKYCNSLSIVIVCVVLMTACGSPEAPVVEPQFDCLTVEDPNSYTIIIINDGRKTPLSGSGSGEIELAPGEYYIGMALGDNVGVTIPTETIELILLPCITTHWVRAFFTSDTSIKIDVTDQ